MHLKSLLQGFIFLFFIFFINSAEAQALNQQEEENEKLCYLQKVQGAANILAGVTLFCDPVESAQFIAAEALFLLSVDLFHLCATDLENEETKKKAISHFKSAALNATAAYSILYGAAEYYFACDPKYIYFGSMLLIGAGVNTILYS